MVTTKIYTSFKDVPCFISSRGAYATDVPISHILTKIAVWEEQGLIMQPDFQRAHVWTEAQQTAYIEFLLRYGRSGRDIYFNHPSWNEPVPDGAYNDFVCVDGLQRITAITRFLRDEIPAFGTLYTNFKDRLPVHQTLRFNVHSLPQKVDVLNWYLEMNAGGTPHTKRELQRVQAMVRDELGLGRN